MGILNVTPDSFSDGGMHKDISSAVRHGIEMASRGADIIDIGGESTRPGSHPVSAAEELSRVLPVIRELATTLDIPISIDTTKAVVAEKAIEAGAEIINDISALRFDPAMATVAAETECPVIVMHMLGTPATMQKNIFYNSIVTDIIGFLSRTIEDAVKKGISEEKIMIDPGIGFGKRLEQGDNFLIIKELDRFKDLGRPVVAGLSRKAFITALTGKNQAQRDQGSAAAAAIAVLNGADIIRTHNVEATKTALIIADAVKRA